MTKINWAETIPSISSTVGSFPRYAVSVWTAISAGLATEHYWPGTGGGSDASIGDLLPGASRAFFDVKSNISSANSGALYLTSDTSQLVGYLSAGTYQLGTPFFERQGQSATSGYWCRQTGFSTFTIAQQTSSVITFSPSYLTVPSVFLTPASTGSWIVWAKAISATTFNSSASSLANASAQTVYWEALGIASSGSF